MPRLIALLLVVASFVVAPLTTSAALITLPPGLNSGDQYRLVFVTSTSTDALSPDIAYYNNFVNAAAASVPELAALGTTWKVIGSTSSIDARDNTGTNPLLSIGVPMFRLDGVRVAQNNADLWDGALEAPIGISELGNVRSTRVKTGTETDGRAGGPFGSGFANNGYSGPGAIPPAEYLWIKNYSPAPADEPGALYAISGILPIPEPSTYLLGTLALLGLLAFRPRR